MVLNATNLLMDLDDLGIEVGAEGGRLWCRPQSAVTPKLGERLKTHKTDLLEILDLPFDDPSVFWIRALEQNWLDARDEDVDYLTLPRPPIHPCAWCGGRVIHNPLCDELRASWVPRWKFGKKHKGKRVDEIPKEYLAWALGARAIRDADMLDAVRQILGVQDVPLDSPELEPAA